MLFSQFNPWKLKMMKWILTRNFLVELHLDNVLEVPILDQNQNGVCVSCSDFFLIFFLWSILEFLGKILKKNIFPFVHIEHNSKSTSYLVMACLCPVISKIENQCKYFFLLQISQVIFSKHLYILLLLAYICAVQCTRMYIWIY